MKCYQVIERPGSVISQGYWWWSASKFSWQVPFWKCHHWFFLPPPNKFFNWLSTKCKVIFLCRRCIERTIKNIRTKKMQSPKHQLSLLPSLTRAQNTQDSYGSWQCVSVHETLHRGHLEQDKLQAKEAINQNSESWPQLGHLTSTLPHL